MSVAVANGRSAGSHYLHALDRLTGAGAMEPITHAPIAYGAIEDGRHARCIKSSRYHQKRGALMARYWAVQPYRPGGRVQPERRCADFSEVLARVRKFRSTNMDPEIRLRVYVPAYAPDRERHEIAELGIEAI